MKVLLNKVLKIYLKQRLSKIEEYKNFPIEVQQKVFSNLIKKAENTEWGRKYEFSTIRDVKTFQERLPVQDYEQIKPYVERMQKGENNLLWPSKIKWFSKSSGTTGDKSKFIPVSNEALNECHFNGGKDAVALYYGCRPDARLFTGKGLVLGGSHNISPFNKNSSVGDVSGILIQNFPRWAEFARTPHRSVALMSEWDKKLDRIANATIHQNVTNLSGVPSWNLVLLKKILEITGKGNILEVWPNLELFFHGGISFAPYSQQFKKLIPTDRMWYMESYNASEGFFGIQDTPHSDEMLLMLDHGVFYEFIRMDELGKEHPKALTLDQVRVGVNYALVITTNAGLWRYLIGDTIQFTSLKPYRFRVSGRTKNFINAFGEEVIIDNAERALSAACSGTGAIISEYTAAPVFLEDNNSASHEYLIEFEVEPDSLDNFVSTLDSELQQLNSDYEAKRSSDIMLKKPKVKMLPRGTFYKWLKSNNKVGGQNKVPRLFNGRKYADEILALI